MAKKKMKPIILYGWMDIISEFTDWRDETDITIHKSKIQGDTVREVTITIEEVSK